MNCEDELKLSFYKEIASVSERHGVKLVQHKDTGKIYVKKELTHYDVPIFEIIRDGHFAGVPVIKELIESEDKLTVIEDYISGHSVDELLEPGPFSVKETIRVISDLCDILEPFHTSTPQIVHRDIKASNVIIDNEGKVYLIDFDASKFVIRGRNRDTDLIGTEEYAAPEQYGFGQSDQRTDIYALGVLMNKMLTDSFPQEKMFEGRLSQVIRRAIEIDPENRYQNVRELKRALKGDRIEGADNVEVEYVTAKQDVQEGILKRGLSRLPYPIRELPGFRSGNPLFFCLALVSYSLLITLGFFGVVKSPDLTPAQNRFYDMAIFLMIIVPTLYLGNYLGIRDRFPSAKSSGTVSNFIRIGVGALASEVVVILAVTIAVMILGM